MTHKKFNYLKKNIYPRSLENIRAVLHYYFTKSNLSEIEEYSFLLYDENKMSLDQIESYGYLISESTTFFEQHLKGYIEIKNMFNYLYQATELEEIQWRGSKSRLHIIKCYKEYLIVSGLI